MDNKILEKIFPKIKIYDKLKYDLEGLWSITHPKQADEISNLIKKHIKQEEIIITDCTAGLGGNTLSFANFFFKVNSIEIDNSRYNLLENNIKQYNYLNIKLFNNNFLEKISEIKQDVLFLDPPWGGPNYKSKSTIYLKIGDKEIDEVINIIAKECKLITLKLPINFNMNKLKKKIKFKYKKYYVKNILLLIIFIS